MTQSGWYFAYCQPPFFMVLERRLGFNFIKYFPLNVYGIQLVGDQLDQTEFYDVLIGDDEGFFTLNLGEIFEAHVAIGNKRSMKKST